jgi:hypothetical protein
LVRQQRDVNTAPFRKVVQHRHAVIADCRHPQTELAEFIPILFQLDQLGFAKGSPIRGPVEHKDSALGSQQASQIAKLAILIGQFEASYSAAHWRAIVSSRQTVTKC